METHADLPRMFSAPHSPGRLMALAVWLVVQALRDDHMAGVMAIQIRTSLAEPETGEAFVPHKPARPEKAEGGKPFKLVSEYEPAGDQPTAIRELVEGIGDNGDVSQVLLGVTGSGKTFTMAKVIETLQRPALVIAPNKILAAQLYGEFKSFFPDNAVEFFVSYYDYYQPEAYVPRSDTYIEKEAQRERGDRPHAPLGDAVAARARRRDHRRLCLLSLRHRFGRNLFGDDLQPQEGQQRGPTRGDPQARRAPVQAQRPGVRARQFPREGRQSRNLSVAL